MSRSLLFVGGVADGRRTPIEDGVNYYSVPIFGNDYLFDNQCCGMNPSVADTLGKFPEPHVYVRERIRGVALEHSVMRYSEMRVDQLITRLLDNYHPL